MGEIVGMAAYVCMIYHVDPRDVYTHHLDDLKELMQSGVGKLPPVEPAGGSVEIAAPKWLAEVGANVARDAKISAPPARDADKQSAARINDGLVNPLRNDQRWLSEAPLPHQIEFDFAKPQAVVAARVVSGYVTGGGVIGAIENFALEYHDGTAWQSIEGAQVTGNSQVDWSARFAPITAAKFRLTVTKTQVDVSRIWEVELYGAKPSSE
jgi:hypothetical protein